jgi:hypothetical protein
MLLHSIYRLYRSLSLCFLSPVYFLFCGCGCGCCCCGGGGCCRCCVLSCFFCWRGWWDKGWPCCCCVFLFPTFLGFVFLAERRGEKDKILLLDDANNNTMMRTLIKNTINNDQIINYMGIYILVLVLHIRRQAKNNIIILLFYILLIRVKFDVNKINICNMIYN